MKTKENKKSQFQEISQTDLVKIYGGKITKSNKNKKSNFLWGVFHGLK
ncbi:ComC/BlpC family leader-containing pheromone/bacteriocin [Levilactobacillus andaensis]|nr:ComC/BlpC family leader-containing pheromone/bacteriocin [Levilactobacillus andaensis]